MAMNPFPPRAYTRETLVKAYQWLQAQSPQLKDLASTPDLLISLYEKAQMQGRDALERPTLANFKSELKSLAGMMGEFETHAEGQAERHDAPLSVTARPPSAHAQMPSAQTPKHASKAQNSHAQSQMSLNLHPNGLPALPVIPVTAHSSQTASRMQLPPNELPPNMPPHLRPQHISSTIPPYHASQTQAPLTPPTPAAPASLPQQMPLTPQNTGPTQEPATSAPPSVAQPPPTPPQETPPTMNYYGSSSASQERHQEYAAAAAQPPQNFQPTPFPVYPTQAQAPVVTNPPVITNTPATRSSSVPALIGPGISINDESLAQLQTIMREMNLSSTDEALRLALTIGFGRLAELFPQRGPKRS